MTTVTEARRELAQIAERQAELQAIVDAAPKSLLTKGDRYSIGGPMRAGAVDDLKTREAYAEALDTLLMLRHQPGSEAVSERGIQFVVTTDGVKVYAIDMFPDMRKLTRISPYFATKWDAEAAINTIGADRILRMFRTLHGVAA